MSVSAPVTLPVTTPVVVLGAPTALVAVGALFFGRIGTVTARLVAAPLASVTVTVTVSVIVTAVAPSLAAACRAVGVGV